MDQRGLLGPAGCWLWYHGSLRPPRWREHPLEAEEGLEGRCRACQLQRCVANLRWGFNEEFSLTLLIIALFSMFAFIIVSDLFRTSRLPDFVDVYLGAGLRCPPSFLAHSHLTFM